MVENKILKRGSVTVEASLLLPIILMSVLILIFVVIVQYDIAIAKKYTEQAATAIATYHNPKYSTKYSNISSIDTTDNLFVAGTKRVDVADGVDLYWRIAYNTDYSEELMILNNALASRLVFLNIDTLTTNNSSNQLIRTTPSGDVLTLNAKREGNIMNAQIAVTTNMKYKLPFSDFMNLDYYEVEFTTKMPVIDNPEFIRNYDLAMDMATRLPLIETVRSEYVTKVQQFEMLLKGTPNEEE